MDFYLVSCLRRFVLWVWGLIVAVCRWARLFWVFDVGFGGASYLAVCCVYKILHGVEVFCVCSFCSFGFGGCSGRECAFVFCLVCE